MASLLKHFMLTSVRGKTFFTKGEAAMAQMPPDQPAGPQCPDQITPEFEVKTSANMGKVCKSCHAFLSPTFVDEQGKFNPSWYWESGDAGVPETPEDKGALWHKILCKVSMSKMPPQSAPVKFQGDERANAQCYLRRTIDKMAAAGQIPAGYLGKSCEGAASPSANSGAHPVTGVLQPPAPGHH